MQNQLYHVFDIRARQTLGPIIAVPRDAAAIRMFNEIAAQKDTDVSRYIDDFVLLHLGQQDSESGELTPRPGGPEPIWTGYQYKAEALAANQAAADTTTAANNNGAAIVPSPALPPGSEAARLLARGDLSEAQLEEEYNKRLLEIRRRRGQ